MNKLLKLLILGIFLNLVSFADGAISGCSYVACKNHTLDRCERYKFPKLGIGLVTAYTEYYKGEEGCRRSLCCTEGSAEVKTYRRGPGCLATKCVPKDVGNPCKAFDLKKDEKSMGIELEATFNETCKLANGQEGSMSICCQPGHPERFLTVGYAAEKHEFPHHVRINVGCGGTIYNDQWIITAAHCMVSDGAPVNASDVIVWMGTNIATNWKNKYNAIEIIVNKNYSFLAGNEKIGDNMFRIKSDIALIKLDRKIKFSKTIRPLTIAPPDFNPIEFSNEGIVIGWGKSDNYQTPQLLRKSFVPLRPVEVCSKIWGNPPHRFFSEQAVCVGGIVKLVNGTSSHGVVAGQGDSGGPAICKDKDGFAVLCGVTSYGGSDAKCQKYKNPLSCLPSIYTSVSYFRSWIEKHAGVQEVQEDAYKLKFSGRSVNPEESRHQLMVVAEGQKSCGGTLVAKNYVVTAAHCVYRLEDKSRMPVRRGDLKVTTQDAKQSFEVASILSRKWKNNFKANNKLAIFSSPFKKSDFKILDDFYYDYDIAVLKLKGEINNIKPIRLPPHYFDSLGKGIQVSETAWQNSALEERKIHLISQEKCQHRFSALNIRIMNSNSKDFTSPEWSSNSTTTPSPLTDISLEESDEELENTNYIDIEDWNSNSVVDSYRQFTPIDFFLKEGTITATNNTSGGKNSTSTPNISKAEIKQWVRDMKNFELSQRELCYVEDHSGGSTCDRGLGGAIICKDQKQQEYLCGVQTFRLCFGSFPNIMVDVRQFRDEINAIIRNK